MGGIGDLRDEERSGASSKCHTKTDEKSARGVSNFEKDLMQMKGRTERPRTWRHFGMLFESQSR